MKVLYVEDHEANVFLMQSLFSMRPDMELEVALTGEDGYRAATQAPPDLLLLDLRLPDCHGAQLLERLRRHPQLASVPAAAVTAEEFDPADTSFSEVWSKPLDIAQTLSRLDSLSARAASLRKNNEAV